jgi:hypothetical protein
MYNLFGHMVCVYAVHCNGPFTLGRMPFRLFSEYESGGIFETVRISRRMVSEWFPNTPNDFRIDRILSERFPYAFRMLSEHGEFT